MPATRPLLVCVLAVCCASCFATKPEPKSEPIDWGRVVDPDGDCAVRIDKAKLTMSFKRPDMGHVEFKWVLDDPKTYTKPISNERVFVLTPNVELIEYSCMEGNLQSLLDGEVQKSLNIAKILGNDYHLAFMKNGHPLVPLSTLQAGYRLMMHGLDVEGLHGWLRVLKRRAQSSSGPA